MSQQNHYIQVKVDTYFIGKSFALWIFKLVLYIGRTEVTCRGSEVIIDVEVSCIKSMIK